VSASSSNATRTVLRLGIPKGSLQEQTIELFRRAGWRITVSSRSYFPAVDDPDISCLLIRAQEMARYVEKGVLDAGLTGLDWVLENESDVEIVSELVYSRATFQRARWVLAVPEGSRIRRIEDCANATIATELVGFTSRYFHDRGVPVKVEFSWGATEAKVIEGLADALVDITETGSTLKANGLRIVETLLETSTRLIANKVAMREPAKRDKVRQIALLLQGALNAESMVGIKMNVAEGNLERLIALLPSLKAPTVARLHGTDWFAVESVISESVVRDLIPRLIATGADGIIEYPLNKIVNREPA
jgi:ATP phosphoribosyltransferase